MRGAEVQCHSSISRCPQGWEQEEEEGERDGEVGGDGLWGAEDLSEVGGWGTHDISPQAVAAVVVAGSQSVAGLLVSPQGNPPGGRPRHDS